MRLWWQIHRFYEQVKHSRLAKIAVATAGGVLFLISVIIAVFLSTAEDSKLGIKAYFNQSESKDMRDNPLMEDRQPTPGNISGGQLVDDNDLYGKKDLKSNQGTFPVCISGAVKKPGVYQVHAGAYLQELIDLAGGFTEKADTRSINLAGKLEQNELYVVDEKNSQNRDGLAEPAEPAEPSDDNTDSPPGDTFAASMKMQKGGYSAKGKGSGRRSRTSKGRRPAKNNRSKKEHSSADRRQRVNINTASATELATLPGIGTGTAQKIIDYRKRHGKFAHISDITKVAGIKEAKYSKIKDKIFT